MNEELLRIADRVVEMAGSRAEAEVLVTAGEASLTRFANSFIHQNVGEAFEAVSLRLVVDGRAASGSTNRAGDESLRDLVARTAEIARLQPPDPEWPGLAPPAAVAEADRADPGTVAATPGERAAAVEAFVAAGGGYRAAGYCDVDVTGAAFANSEGQRVSGSSSRATIDGIHQTGESAGSAHQTSRRFADIDGAGAGALAAERARMGIGAFDLKPGEYEVVLAPEAVGTIVVFLGFYGFNGKQVAEGQSFVELGTPQFDERIGLWDDGSDPGALGLPFDVEGTPKQRIDLVADGITAGVVHDRRTAGRVGGASTGHAIPGSETVGPVPTNLVLGGGDDPVEEMIASVERGLYVATFNYCRVLEPKSLVVTGLTRNGTFMIENGRITGAVTNLRFTQSFVRALGPGKVLGIGDDARFADSEFGVGLVAVPSLRLAGWSFTGGADG
jgi:predicted Zn-dependent protease